MAENRYEKSERLLREWMKSDDAKIYWEKEAQKIVIKQKRYERVEKWLENHDFEALMYRLILVHGDDYREKCYHNGYQPYPNRKMSLLIDYITHTLEPIRVPQLESIFSNQIWFFKGYYFQMTWGQGVVTDIYNGQDMKHLLSI